MHLSLVIDSKESQKGLDPLISVVRVYRVSLGPKPRKSLKRVSRTVRPGEPPRVWKRSRKSPDSLEKVPKDFFETFFRLFRGFGPGGPERLL